MKHAPRTISFYYKRLLTHFGRQGWWPVTPPHGTRPVYTPGKSLARLAEAEKFEVCVGAILTQNTSWSNVEKALMTLKSAGQLSYKALRKIRRKNLEKLIRSSGYFRQKSERVQSFLAFVDQTTKGNFRKLFSGPLGEVRERLLRQPGIGPETADSMLLYGAGRPIFVVDAYTRRIAARWGVIKGDEPYEAVQNIFMNELPRSAAVFGEAHALLVELAKAHCRKAPQCAGCPLGHICPTGREKIL